MSILQNIHSYWSYIVLGVLVIAILNAFIGRFSDKPFTIKDLRISLFALIVTHIQLLIGLTLYFVSPRFSAWQEGMGAIMGDSTLRLYLIEHPVTNILAVVLITMGWSMHKRQTKSRKRFMRIGLFYLMGLVLLLSRIPWSEWP
jgi:hypothetical protein|tara:strand:- start:1092 stop:1523 length:432 start_codon:yes stop_codon:yes gene_type:complete